MDLVKQNEILKEQTLIEEKVQKEWHKKWGFYLDFDKMRLEEAERRGIPKDKFLKLVTFRKRKREMTEPCWEIEIPSKFPSTTNGFVGWRADLRYSLEKVGPFYISPKSTLPKEDPVYTIYLG